MSSTETPTGEALETGRPSVRLTRNAKGDVQIDVKAYGTTADEFGLAEAAASARATFDELARTYPSSGAR